MASAACRQIVGGGAGAPTMTNRLQGAYELSGAAEPRGRRRDLVFFVCVHMCVCVRMFVCVRSCVRVRVCVHACVCCVRKCIVVNLTIIRFWSLSYRIIPYNTKYIIYYTIHIYIYNAILIYTCIHTHNAIPIYIISIALYAIQCTKSYYIFINDVCKLDMVALLGPLEPP